ncbi:hypothetical protein ROS217_07864 [Roseovarius sp. 217]|nr:hypothetical protein ROS217_07864 [Roseovarius sp. 217]
MTVLKRLEADLGPDLRQSLIRVESVLMGDHGSQVCRVGSLRIADLGAWCSMVVLNLSREWPLSCL